MLEQSIDLEDRLGDGGPDLVSRLRGADARRRQAADPPLRGERRGHLPPPRRRRRQADPQADAGAAVLQGPDRGGLPSSSSSTCASTATARGSRPTPPYAATSATPATSSSACTCSPGPTAPPATSARPTGCDAPTTSSRPDRPKLSEEEELASIRPDLDGNQIMEILGIGPGREVGEAYRHLLELRLDRGPMTHDEAQGRTAGVGRPPGQGPRAAALRSHCTAGARRPRVLTGCRMQTPRSPAPRGGPAVRRSPTRRSPAPGCGRAPRATSPPTTPRGSTSPQARRRSSPTPRPGTRRRSPTVGGRGPTGGWPSRSSTVATTGATGLGADPPVDEPVPEPRARRGRPDGGSPLPRSARARSLLPAERRGGPRRAT